MAHSPIPIFSVTASSVISSAVRNRSLVNWTEMPCSWLDEIYHIQNNFYSRYINSRLILALYAIVCIIGAIANLLVIISFAKVSQLRNLRNYFIVNLAVSDLLLCTVTAPMTLYLTLNLFWPFGQLACQIVASMQAVNLFVSCLTLVLIAMDRFLLTLCPVKWRLAAKAPLVCYLVVWLTSVLVAAPYFFAVSSEDVTMFDPWNTPHAEHMLEICDRSKPQMCSEKTWDRLPFSHRVYTLTVLAVQYLLPLGALGFAYSRIGSTIRRRVKHSTTVDNQRKQQMSQKSRKALLLLLFLVLVYAVAWLPMNAYNVLNVLDVIKFSQQRYIFCHLIGMCSACLNPILYALINDSFRNAFFSLIQPLFSSCTKYISVHSEQPNQNNGHTYTSAVNATAKKIDSPTKNGNGRLIIANGNSHYLPLKKLSQPTTPTFRGRCEAADDQQQKPLLLDDFDKQSLRKHSQQEMTVIHVRFNDGEELKDQPEIRTVTENTCV